MNNSVVKVKTAGKVVPGTDGARELVEILVNRPCLGEDEFDLHRYIRNLENVLNDKDTSDEEYHWVLNRINFLGGTVEWEEWDGNEVAFVTFSHSAV